MIIVKPPFSKSSVFTMFPYTRKRKSGVFKLLQFQKPPFFCYGLLSEEGRPNPALEIKLRFQIPPAESARDLKAVLLCKILFLPLKNTIQH